LLKLGLLKYTANPAMIETTAIAISNALKLSLFVIQIPHVILLIIISEFISQG
jgi:hypothetical protein